MCDPHSSMSTLFHFWVLIYSQQILNGALSNRKGMREKVCFPVEKNEIGYSVGLLIVVRTTKCKQKVHVISPSSNFM
jgi:hypothetical protein